MQHVMIGVSISGEDKLSKDLSRHGSHHHFVQKAWSLFLSSFVCFVVSLFKNKKNKNKYHCCNVVIFEFLKLSSLYSFFFG